MNGATTAVLAAGAIVTVGDLPSLPSPKRLAAVVAVAVVVSATAGVAPQLANGLAGLILVAVVLTSGVPAIRRILN